MEDHEQETSVQSLATLTAEIVSAYVSNNTIAASQIGQLISDVSRQLHDLDKPQEQQPAKPEPAVPVRRSIGSDHLICLCCGKKQRMLKRHLTSEHQMTPEEYRRLFDLKHDYPMVAPSYAEMRRELALKIGLGRPKKQAPRKRAAPKVAAKSKEAPTKTRRTRAKTAA
jgi:predicted transcriptional regulator